MAQRNMVVTRQMLDPEMGEQIQGQLNPEPCFLLGNMAHYPHPNIYPMVIAPGSTSDHDLRHLPDHNVSTSSVFYGVQSSGLQHHHPFADTDLGASSSYSSTYVIPSSDSRICPYPPNHRSTDQPPSSASHGFVGVGATNGYEGNNHFMDGVRSSCKRKNAENPMNHHYFNGPASSSSSSLSMPPNTVPVQSEGHLEPGTGMLNFSTFRLPEYRANGIFPITEGGSGSRSNALGLGLGSTMLNHSNLAQGSYMGQSFQPTSNDWVENRFVNGGMPWNCGPVMPYLHGGIVDESSLEMMSMGGQGYSDPMNSRSSTVLPHPTIHHHHFHHAAPLMQAMPPHGYNYHPQAPIPSYRHTTNNALHHAATPNSSVDGSETGLRYLRPLSSLVSSDTGPRYPRPLPSNGIRTFRPHQSGAPHSSRPHLRMLSVDEVALLEFPGLYDAGNINDPLEDMRLDIDDMSYEELLALGGRIGDVKAGLSEESILSSLKTRVHFPSTAGDMNQGTCVVCQEEYENQQRVGTLDCGHEYHAGCIKQWLQVKNLCPICKIPAFSMDGGRHG